MSTIKLVTEVPGPNSVALCCATRCGGVVGSARLTGIAVASGDGATVTDVDGNTFLDFAGGIGTWQLVMRASGGRCHP